MLFQAENLTVHYGGAEILKGISFKVAEGQIVTLIGSNGAGKTTTMRTVSGLKSPSRGEIWFEGRRIDQLPPTAIVRAGIVQVPENKGLFPYMSVLENLKIGAYLRKDRHRIQADLKDMYGLFPILADRQAQIAGTLSGGEQQMLAIACALMARPKLLLLDEPSTGLSPRMVKEIGRAVAAINQNGTTVLLVEQNAQMALQLAHWGYALETGKIVLSGKIEDLRNNDHIQKVYLGL